MDTSYGQGWTSAPGDTSPSITVHLTSPSSIDRVLVDTQSVGSVAPGLRDYTVSVDSPTGAWRQVGTVTGQFQNHIEEVDFSPVEATAVKISVETVNFGGYYGGAIPPWWSSTSPAVAFLHAVEVYAGTGGPALAKGLSLQSLGIPALDPPTTPAGPSVPTSTTTTPPTTVPRQSSGTGATSSPVGYWLTTSSGDVFPFGDARSYGSLAGIHLNEPIVGMAATPDGKGYWLVASDGGVFSFGDATFHGSTAGMRLPAPIDALVLAPDAGYWMVSSAGDVYSFASPDLGSPVGAVQGKVAGAAAA
jgi:hypothetical protein